MVNCISDCPTRWNSSYLAWIRLVQIKTYIELLISELSTHDDQDAKKDGRKLRNINLTESEWELIKDLLQVLGPFEEATTYLGGSFYATHSLLYRLIKNLKKKFAPLSRERPRYDEINSTNDIFEDLDEEPLDELEQSQKEQPEDKIQQDHYTKINTPVNTYGLLNKVKKKIYDALCLYYPEPNPEKWISALLDPRCKALDFLDLEDRSDVILLLRELYEQEKGMGGEDQDQGQTSEDVHLHEDDIVITINPLYTPCLIKSLDREEGPAVDEIEEFLKLPQIGLNKDPFAWWDLHTKRFPILSKLAKIYLAASATSTASERLFSDAGNLMSVKRTRIAPELFKRMMFLKRNLDLYHNIHPAFIN